MTRRSPWEILASPAAGGIALALATGAALVVANSPLAPLYTALLHARTGPVLSPALGPMTVHLWIDDALMAVFFLLVGLEIKREFVAGDLSQPARRRLPFVAAAAGMVVPALLYLAIAGRFAGLARGWAIPAATDIAFAVGMLALLGSRVPPAIKVLLSAIAIVDDMGAVAIIALAYTDRIGWWPLAAAACVVAVLYAIGRHGGRRLWPLLIGAALLWFLVLLSGVHATIAGVVAAMLVPIDADPEASPLHRLEHALQPWVALLIVPLFAFANAGIPLGGVTFATLTHPLVLGIAAGLFLGKQIGIFGGIWIAERTGFARRPGGIVWPQVYGLALLAGIGFTMSLFIGNLAFPGDPTMVDRVKLGVLAGSLLAAATGYLVLRFTRGAAATP